MAYHGKFQCKNPKKYRGRLDAIEYRSLWELRMMEWCDKTDAVISWASEEHVIPYFDPIKNKNRRYFMDFWTKMQTPSGIQEYLIEVKPAKESDFFVKALTEGTEPGAPRPKPTSANPKVMQRWYAECATAATNAAKWKAALKFATRNKMKFMIFTERQLAPDQGKARTESKRTQTKKWKDKQKSGASLI